MSVAAKARVEVFSLGGTIASTADVKGTGGVTPRLAAADLVAAVPGLADLADLRTTAFRQVPSGDLTMADIAALAAEIAARLDAGADGVVVTQGTDTIEETAFALDLLVAGPKPVVVTGAMRNPTLPGPDGPANLSAAVAVAAAPQARGLGTVVAFGDEIHAARFVRKTHTASPATFRSDTVGPIGWLAEQRPRIAFRPPELPRPGGTLAAIPPVALFTAGLGDDGRMLAGLVDMGYAGAVIAAFGGGHLPAAMVPTVGRLVERIPVVLASRTGSGQVLADTYGSPGSERDLLGRGLVCAGFLDAPKARVLLGLLLADGADTARVRADFARVNDLW